MPSLVSHHVSKLVKLLYIGDSGTGKTGSLTSLVAAGYKVHVLDLDNGVDILAHFVRKQCPDKLGNIDYVTHRDKYKITAAGAMLSGAPKAFVGACTTLDKWEDGTVPAQWGPEHVLVIDSLSALGKAAFEWAKGMNPTSKDPRQWYAQGQKGVEDVIANLTSEDMNTNVIVTSHVQIVELPDGSMKGYANALGKAMGPVLPRYFNNLVQSERVGSGPTAKRVIRTVPSGLVDLKTAAPFKFDKDYPLETGLATVFSKLKETE